MSLTCRDSCWKDLSHLHRSIRQELEKDIMDYAKTRKCNGSECLTPLIVAPYGSGKTELLQYLCNWAWDNGIPAVYVELRELVDYLREYLKQKATKKLHEGELSRIIESFFNDKIKHIAETIGSSNEEVMKTINMYKNNSIAGVLLIDEIEESYNNLKNLIEFTTSPFRGVFEEIRKGTLKTFAVLAFGPSSALMEVAGLAAGWRTKIISIPLISPRTIEGFENLKKHEISYPYKSLIANMLWWASKGRIGWANSLIENKVVDSIKKLLEELKKEKSYIKRISIPFDEQAREALSKQIVEDVFLFNEYAYTKNLDSIQLPSEKDLFKLLITLVGPVPRGKLEEIINLEELGGVKLEKIVCSNEGISKERLIKKIMETAEILINQLKPNLKPHEHNKILKDLRHIIDTVLESWSYNDIILLPRTNGSYDLEPLEKLKDMAINIALEMYKNDVVDVLDRIDMRRIVGNLINRSPEALVRLDEEYFAVHPEVLLEVYPPIMIKPFIACSKDFRGNLANEIPLEKYLDINEQVKKYLEKALVDKGLHEKASVYFIPDANILKYIRKEILNDIRRKYVVIVPIATTAYKLERLKEEELVKELKPYIELGLVLVADVGLKLSMFLSGLIYSMIKCRSELDIALESSTIDSYIFRQYALNYERMIGETLGQWYEKHRRVELNVRETLKEDTRGLARELERQAGKSVGEKQAVYIWLISLADKEVINELFNAIDTLAKVREKITKVLQDLELDPRIKESAEKTVFGKIGLLTRKQAKEYIEKSVKLANTLTRKIDEQPILQNLVSVINDMIAMEEERTRSINMCTNIEDMVSNVVKRLKQLSITENLEEPLHQILVAYQLKELANEKCGEYLERLLFDIIHGTRELSMLVEELDYLEEDIARLGTEIEKLGLESSPVISKLDKLSSELKELSMAINALQKIVNDSIKLIRRVKAYDAILYVEFVIKMMINVFSENLVKPVEGTHLSFGGLITSQRDRIEHITELLTAIEDEMYRLKKDPNILSNLEKLATKNPIDALRKDLNNILSSSRNLEELENELNKYVELDLIEKLLRIACRAGNIKNDIESVRQELTGLLKLFGTIKERTGRR